MVAAQGSAAGGGVTGPAAVRAEAEGGALLVAALLRCMQPLDGGGDAEVQARSVASSAAAGSDRHARIGVCIK